MGIIDNLGGPGNPVLVTGTVVVDPAAPVHVIVDNASLAVTGPLTDTQLRAVAVPVSVSGTVTTGGLTDAQLRATPVPMSGAVSFTAPQHVVVDSGTTTVSNFPATQPVSGTVTVANPGLTDTQLRATAVPVSGSITATVANTVTTTPAAVDTYRTAATAVAVSDTVPFLTLFGSATKVVKITRITLSGPTIAVLAVIGVQVRRMSAAPTGGTSTALAVVKLDSASPTSTITGALNYSAAPTAGTSVGVVSTWRALALIAGVGIVAATVAETSLRFGDIGAGSPLILRGISEGIALGFDTAPGGAVTLAVTIEWEEV